jgi:iron complex transport system substrate-binding protein
MPTRAAVWAIDADAVVVRPGPRLVDGVHALAAAFFGPEIAGLPALPAEVIQRLR